MERISKLSAELARERGRAASAERELAAAQERIVGLESRLDEEVLKSSSWKHAYEAERRRRSR